MKLLLASACALIALAAPALADTIIAPGGSGTAQGVAPLRFFGSGGSNTQMIYDASFFGGPVSLSALSFRAYPGAGPSGFFTNSITISDISVRLTTTTLSANEASGLQPGTNFAANLGTDFSTVYSGALTLTTAATGTGPQPFDYTINFATPFIFDPANGNLLLDVLIPTGATLGATSGFAFGFLTFDNANILNDGIRSIVNINDGSATDGVLDTSGAITAFNATPIAAAVPEPASWALLIGGIGAVGGVARRRRTTTIATA